MKQYQFFAASAGLPINHPDLYDIFTDYLCPEWDIDEIMDHMTAQQFNDYLVESGIYKGIRSVSYDFRKEFYLYTQIGEEDLFKETKITHENILTYAYGKTRMDYVHDDFESVLKGTI